MKMTTLIFGIIGGLCGLIAPAGAMYFFSESGVHSLSSKILIMQLACAIPITSFAGGAVANNRPRLAAFLMVTSVVLWGLFLAPSVMNGNLNTVMLLAIPAVIGAIFAVLAACRTADESMEQPQSGQA